MRKIWKIKQGSTALVEGYASIVEKEIKEEKHFLLRMETGYCVFAYRNGLTLELYSFHQYDSEVLPEHLRGPFAKLMPADAVLTRPAKEPTPRVFPTTPLR